MCALPLTIIVEPYSYVVYNLFWFTICVVYLYPPPEYYLFVQGVESEMFFEMF